MTHKSKLKAQIRQYLKKINTKEINLAKQKKNICIEQSIPFLNLEHLKL